ncbi:tyrosine-type recombinase/integrase [bacterium]|nr:tyrosine-type recombinase/integrase [bacterium]
MAELVFSTSSFRPFGLATPDVPILLDAQMRLIEPACAWFLHLALVQGRTRSPATWRTYAEALYDWWRTCETNGWQWDRVSYEEVAAYRDRMLSGTSDLTRRPYARSTINGRLRILALFYGWCAQRGLITAVPFRTGELAVGRAQAPQMLAHVDARGGRQKVNELTVRHTQPLPRALPIGEIRRVMAPMGARDRLIVEWALMTGARRMEIAGLKLAQLPATESARSDDRPVVPIQLETAKGGKSRHIYPPLALIDRTHAYVREERATALRGCDTQTEPALFLTDNGRPLTSRRIGANFAAACKRAGLAGTFHALRHTFAGAMLALLQRQTQRIPELNPLLTLQTILGHADPSTTMIYLRMLATDLTAIEDALGGLYEALA